MKIGDLATATGSGPATTPMDEIASSEFIALDLVYQILPRPWTDEELEAAVVAQRAERDRRVAKVAKATKVRRNKG